MDAVKYLKTLCRMCHCECLKCEFGKARSGFETCPIWQRTHPEEAVAIMEQWAAEHPAKTRQSVFLEQYPEAELTKDGVISICPIAVSAAYRNKTSGCASPTRPRCEVCLREFWMQEVEDGSAD